MVAACSTSAQNKEPKTSLKVNYILSLSRDNPGPTYPWILLVAYPTLKVTQWYLL